MPVRDPLEIYKMILALHSYYTVSLASSHSERIIPQDQRYPMSSFQTIVRPPIYVTHNATQPLTVAVALENLSQGPQAEMKSRAMNKFPWEVKEHW